MEVVSMLRPDEVVLTTPEELPESKLKLTDKDIREAVGLFLDARTNEDAIMKYGDIEEWDVSEVSDMSRLFCDSKTFNADISRWDTSSVKNMAYMLHGCTTFNQSLSNWKTAKVTCLARTFAYAKDFNQPLDTWDTSNVTTMEATFESASNFNQSLSNWKTAKVTCLARTFAYAKHFNQPLDTWDTSNVTTMESTFCVATSYDQPMEWDVSNVQVARSCFSGANSFTQNLSKWDLRSASRLRDMFYTYPEFPARNKPPLSACQSCCLAYQSMCHHNCDIYFDCMTSPVCSACWGHYGMDDETGCCLWI